MMSTHIVVFQPDGACMEVEPGKTILEVATAAGVALDSACGGQGTCGKCKVLVTLGRPGGRPGDQLTRAEIDQGMVLACQATVDDDLVVEIPTESQRSDLRILTEQVGAELRRFRHRPGSSARAAEAAAGTGLAGRRAGW